MRLIVLHTTTDSEPLARTIATEAVAQQLAACVQIVPIQSVYRWKNQIETAAEYRCELKTTDKHIAALRTLITQQHSYDTPEIVEFEILNASDAYQSWLVEQLRTD